MKTLLYLAPRVIVGLLILLILLLLVGFVYQQVATFMDRRNTSFPGQMVNVNGYQLYMKAMGEANICPPVILANGGGGIVPQWGWIQPEIAQFTKVVAYDRPATGLSEGPSEELDALGSVEALHEALETLEIEGPYVLVGHSMGGLMMRVFAKLYPEDVAGIVLVDPRDTTWQGVYREEEARVPVEAFRFLQVLSHFGVTRLTGFAANQVEGLPEESYERAVVVGSTPDFIAGMLNDARYGETAIQFLREGESLEDTPLLVLSAGAPDESFDASQRENFISLHSEIAAKSSRGEHRIIPGAGHVSIVMREQYAQVVADAVREMCSGVQVTD